MCFRRLRYVEFKAELSSKKDEGYKDIDGYRFYKPCSTIVQEASIVSCLSALRVNMASMCNDLQISFLSDMIVSFLGRLSNPPNAKHFFHYLKK